MILVLLRVEDMTVEDMIKRSFSEFSSQRSIGDQDLPSLLTRGVQLLKQLDEDGGADAMPCVYCGEPHEDYYWLSKEVQRCNGAILGHMMQNCKHAAAAISPGRLLLVSPGQNRGRGAKGRLLVNTMAMLLRTEVRRLASGDTVTSFVVLVLCPPGFAPRSGGATGGGKAGDSKSPVVVAKTEALTGRGQRAGGVGGAWRDARGGSRGGRGREWVRE